MMAGGDLDGDVYFVTWQKELVSNLPPHKVHPPAVYTKPKLVETKPKVEHIADYLCFYFANDNLGKIANIHLALCDQKGREGPMSKECLELSALQSVAVDFAKHG